MSSKSKCTESACLLTGLGAGLALVLLFTPRSGRKIRGLIHKRARAGKERLRATAGHLAEQGKRFVDCGANPPRPEASPHGSAGEGETIIEST